MKLRFLLKKVMVTCSVAALLAMNGAPAFADEEGGGAKPVYLPLVMTSSSNQSSAAEAELEEPLSFDGTGQSTVVALDESTAAPAVEAAAVPPSCVTFVSTNFTSNRGSGLPNNRAQIVIWYDGNVVNQPAVKIQYADPTGATGSIVIGGPTDPGGLIDRFSTQVETREYNLGNCTITGLVSVGGVTPDGVIDGMAIGIYTKNGAGQYDLWQSWSGPLPTNSHYVGGWPAGITNAWFGARTPQLSNNFSRQQARTIITSAKYLTNGVHNLSNQAMVATPPPALNPAVDPICGLGVGPVYLTQNLTSNRWGGLPANRLQAVVWYDGAITATTPTVQLQYFDPATNAPGWLTIGNPTGDGAIQRFDQRIATREFNLGTCKLTGVIQVNGVVPDGVIDGVALGLYTKDVNGQYKVYQSWSSSLNTTSDFVGAWPAGLDDTIFAPRVPQVTDSYARQTAQMLIMGAKYLGNGQHYLGSSQ